MKASLRTLTVLYTLALAFGVSLAVGGAMYGISSESLRRAYENRFEASSREASRHLVDPVYQLDALAVLRTRERLAQSNPSLERILVLGKDDRPFGGWIAWQQGEVAEQIERVRRTSQWLKETRGEIWRFVGPIVDSAGQTQGFLALEYSTAELRRDLNQTALAALATTLLVTLVGCLAGLLLSRRATRPFTRLVESVREIGEQQFQKPVQIAAFEELRDLGDAIGRMASRLDQTTVSLEEAETARRTAEQANRLKNRFLANLSHEIRTPLHAIVGYADLLRAEGIGPAQEPQVEGIQTASESLQRLIEDILDLSMIESGNLELTQEPLDLVHLVHEVVEINAFRARPGTLDLFGVVGAEVARHRLGDPDRIRQVLIHLVSNALKFTTQGQVILEVLAGEEDEVLFIVQDSGRGIPEADMEALFQPFARNSGDASISGAGLGLALCRQLARVMGARLHLQSQQGQGTRASFELKLNEDTAAESTTDPSRDSARQVRFFGFPPPVQKHLCERLLLEAPADATRVPPGTAAILYPEGLEDPQDALESLVDFDSALIFSPSNLELAKPEHAQAFQSPITTWTLENALARNPVAPVLFEADFQGLEILVVEDNPVNQLVLSAMLEQLGCTVHLAGNGREGIEAWRQHSPSMVLMDCSMPILDGFEATRRIRLDEATLARGQVPIVAVTAHARREDRIRCREAGMNSFLSKPLTLEQLQITLSQWFAPPD